MIVNIFSHNIDDLRWYEKFGRYPIGQIFIYLFCLHFIYSAEYYKVKREVLKNLPCLHYLVLMIIPMFFGWIETFILQAIHTAIHLVCLIPVFFYYPSIYATFDKWERKLEKIHENKEDFSFPHNNSLCSLANQFHLGKFFLGLFVLCPLFIVNIVKKAIIEYASSPCLGKIVFPIAIVLVLPIFLISYLFVLVLSFLLHFFTEKLMLLPYYLNNITDEMLGNNIDYMDKEMQDYMSKHCISCFPYSMYKIFAVDLPKIIHKKYPKTVIFYDKVHVSHNDIRIGVTFLGLFYVTPWNAVLLIIAYILCFPFFLLGFHSFRNRIKLEKFLLDFFDNNTGFFEYIHLIFFGYSYNFLSSIFKEAKASEIVCFWLLWVIVALFLQVSFILSSAFILPFVLISPSLGKIADAAHVQIKLFKEKAVNIRANIHYLGIGFVLPLFWLLKKKNYKLITKIALVFPMLLMGIVFWVLWWVYFILCCFFSTFYWGFFNATFGSVKLEKWSLKCFYSRLENACLERNCIITINI